MLKVRVPFLAVAILLSVGWFVAYDYGFLGDLDTRLQDKLLLPRPAATEIVLVTIDNQSLQELGVWPLPRSIHAMAIAAITAQSPKAIGYDVTFSEASTEVEDQILAAELADSGQVILASEAVLELRPGQAPLAVSTLEPLSMFANGARGVGPTTLVPDRDGVIRSVPVSFQTRIDERAPTFASLLAAELQADLTTSADLHRVAYVGGPGSFVSVSLADVVNGKISDGVFTDKLVLVGATAPDLHDEYLTPFGAGQATSGVEIQANIIQSLLEGRRLRTLNDGAVAGLFAGLTVLMLTSSLVFRFRYLAGITAASAVGYIVVAVALAATDLLLPVIHPLLLLALLVSLDVTYRYKDEYTRRSFVETAFGRYVSPVVVDKLVSGEAPLELGGVKEELTILFSDIRGFTSLSEKMAPEELVTFLNEYLDAMTEIVLQHEGTLDKYIGDAVMAFWGAPLTQVDHAERAAATAVAMQQKLAELRQGWEKRQLPNLEIGIGLNTGKVIVGNIGSHKRFDYTVIGDDVNLASRLESLTKLYGVTTLISEATKKQLSDKFLLRPIDKVAVKGKKSAVMIFEVVGELGRINDDRLQFVQAFEQALKLYYTRNWAESAQQFASLAATGDKTSQLFADRARDYGLNEPRADWDGIYVAKDK